MNSMRMLASPTHMPMRYFSGSVASSLVQPGGQSFEPEGPRSNGSPPPGPRPLPPAPMPGLISTSVVTLAGIIDCGLQNADCGMRIRTGSIRIPQSAILSVPMHLSSSRLRLHQVVLRRTGNAVLISTSIDHRFEAREVVVRRRRGNRPLERSRLPRIRRSLGAPCPTPDQVRQEYQLACNRDERHPRNEAAQRHDRLCILKVGVRSIPPGRSGHAHHMKRNEDRVDADERDDEMNLAQAFVHHLAKHLREPEVGASKHSEDRGDSHDQMEVSNDERSIVEWNIKRRLTEEKSGNAARYEQRHEPDCEQHGRGESNLSAPQRAQPVEGLDRRRHANG